MGTSRNTAFTLSAIKLGIFSAISLFLTGLLTVIMGHFSFTPESTYKAVFSSASMLKGGDDVRVAGVTVGQVQDVEILHRTKALVTFSADSSVPLTTASTAQIRYLNLVGDRYLALKQGTPGAPRLQAEGTIPERNTTPALNLTELFNGFQPLFSALNPHEVNQLALNLIRVLQGEGGTVQQLLSNTASLTNYLADRDQLVGQVVTNLSGMLKIVNDHHKQLNNLVVQMRAWMTHLASDRVEIGNSLQDVSSLSAQLASLLTQSRPWLKNDVVQLRRVATILNKPSNQKLLADVIRRLPTSLQRQTRTGTYGSWYNYYLCNFEGGIRLPNNLVGIPGSDVITGPLRKRLANFSFHSTAARCR